jgi:2-succinyl-5-enolpyruvyl-6-hydroxy-3-cyclohexene-1-carboxylate synthase
MTSSANRNLAWCAALADELVRAGVREAVLSPGSRSAPLALAFAMEPRLAVRTILDERSAAFFALGLARAARRPVALVCTSGTAAANYLPAVVEAHYSQIPLLALTADRPVEQRECGAGQTIDQMRLYGGYTRFFAELPAPELTPSAWLHLRATACRAAAAALGSPAGPVHLNLPFREPLDPSEVPADRAQLERLPELAQRGRAEGPLVQVEARAAAPPSAALLERLARWIEEEPRGFIAAGPLDLPAHDANAFARLACAAGWPLLADALSQLRCAGPDREVLVDAHDAVLRAGRFARPHAPRRVLRFGAMLTSKSFRTLLEADPSIEQRVVDPWEWREPTALGVEILRCDPVALARALAERLERSGAERSPEFARRWIDAGRTARHILSSELSAANAVSEPGVALALASVLPPGATLFTASSMPVRDIDSFWPASAPPVRIVGNRGANGIDGTLACALGTAAGAGVRAAIVVVDNDGGGIFEFLPAASRTERALFEACLATPQGVEIAALLASLGLPCRSARSAVELERELRAALAAPGVRFVVVKTDRRENHELHAKLFARVESALAADARGEA